MLPAYGALHHQHALIWNFVLYSLPASQRGVYSSVCVCCTASLPLKAVCVRVRERERFFACGIKRMCVCVCPPRCGVGLKTRTERKSVE